MITKTRRKSQSRQLTARLRAEMQFPDWLSEAIEADSLGNTPSAIDIIYDKIDLLLSARDFALIDAILNNMSTEGPSLTFLMGLLSITVPASNVLPSRYGFFDRVWELCREKGQDPEKLLNGLRRWE